MATRRARQVVARVGDRTYRVPRVCRIFTTGTEAGEYELTADVEITDGQAHFRSIKLKPLRERLTPQVVQRIPWAQIAEGAIARNATDGQGRADSEVRAARARAAATSRARRGRQAGRPPEIRRRGKVDEELLRTVLEHKAAAQELGVRWDHYAADRLHFSPAYLRRLAGRAQREGVSIARPSRGRRRS